MESDRARAHREREGEREKERLPTWPLTGRVAKRQAALSSTSVYDATFLAAHGMFCGDINNCN